MRALVSVFSTTAEQGFHTRGDEPPAPTVRGQGEYIARYTTREVPRTPMDTCRMILLTTLRTAILVGSAALLILVLLPLAVAAQAAAR